MKNNNFKNSKNLSNFFERLSDNQTPIHINKNSNKKNEILHKKYFKIVEKKNSYKNFLGRKRVQSFVKKDKNFDNNTITERVRSNSQNKIKKKENNSSYKLKKILKNSQNIKNDNYNKFSLNLTKNDHSKKSNDFKKSNYSTFLTSQKIHQFSKIKNGDYVKKKMNGYFFSFIEKPRGCKSMCWGSGSKSGLKIQYEKRKALKKSLELFRLKMKNNSQNSNENKCERFDIL